MFLTRTGKKSELSDKDLTTCWPETSFIDVGPAILTLTRGQLILA